MDGKTLYIEVSRDSVVRAFTHIYPNNEYIKSVIENMDMLAEKIPKENMRTFSYEETGKRLMEHEWAKETLKKYDKICLFGGFFDEDRWQGVWDVNIARDDLEKNGYNAEIIKKATLIRNILHEKPAMGKI